MIDIRVISRDLVRLLFKKDKKDIIIYTSGSLFKTFTQLISNIIVLSWISPEYYGVWTSVLLFQTYSLVVQGGVVSGLGRELPYALGEGNKEKAYEYAGVSLSLILIAIVVVFLAGLVFYLKFSNNNEILELSIFVVTLFTISVFYENYLLTTYRSKQDFEILGYIFYFRGFISFVSLVLVYAYGFYGFLIRIVLINFLTVAVMHVYRPIKAKFIINKNSIYYILKVGIPLYFLPYLFSSSMTFDRFWLLTFWGTKTVGFYSLGLVIFNALLQLPKSLGGYLYPKFSYSLGSGINIRAIRNLSLKTNLFFLGLILFFALILVLSLPSLVKEFYPKYQEGILSAVILSFAAAFYASSFGSSLFHSMKKWKNIIMLTAVGSLSNILFTFICIKYFENPLVGVSVGVLISMIIYSIFSNYLIYKLV